jgi:hypothetical protein
MHDVTYTASVFAEDTQQEVKVIVYGHHYASIEVPKEELQLTRAQLLAVGEACYQLADTIMRLDLVSVTSKVTCAECGRLFDLTDEEQASEWYYGHDCEVE